MAEVMKPAIMHIDMDAFYASVEQRDCPAYRGKPVIVGGTVESRGVVSTASYEARKYGVHSAMPMAEAVRRCPDGIYLPVNFKKYREVSAQIMAIFAHYTPEVEALSLDEAFLDLTGSQSLFGPAEDIGWEIKRTIKKELDLTASVGLSYNKFLAKLSSDLNKPDGFCLVKPEDLERVVWPLSIHRMMGVGEKTAQRLEQMGIKTIGQLAKLDKGLMEHLFGVTGPVMVDMANGIDHRKVEPERECKSIGRETTFPKDISSTYELETILFTLADEVCRNLRKQGLKAKTVNIKLKYPDFKGLTRALTLDHYADAFEEIYHQADELFQRNYKEGTPVRLIGVSVSNLKPEEEIMEQQDLFGVQDQKDKLHSLNATLDQLNDKYGVDMVHRARKITNEYNRK